jgi:hypothetical protein
MSDSNQMPPIFHENSYAEAGKGYSRSVEKVRRITPRLDNSSSTAHQAVPDAPPVRFDACWSRKPEGMNILDFDFLPSCLHLGPMDFHSFHRSS